ncbi:hypothetical protein Hdeb2414_s0027g00696761 [Helianthus debilis subsp. tardiflorus]
MQVQGALGAPLLLGLFGWLEWNDKELNCQGIPVEQDNAMGDDIPLSFLIGR